MQLSFDGRIGVGHIITLVVTAATIVTMWNNMSNKLEQLQTTMDGYQQQTSTYADRVRVVELAQASQASDLRNIQIGISEIKTAISEIARTPLTTIPSMPSR